jgi:hypothetical protein
VLCCTPLVLYCAASTPHPHTLHCPPGAAVPTCPSLSQPESYVALLSQPVPTCPNLSQPPQGLLSQPESYVALSAVPCPHLFTLFHTFCRVCCPSQSRTSRCLRWAAWRACCVEASRPCVTQVRLRACACVCACVRVCVCMCVRVWSVNCCSGDRRLHRARRVLLLHRARRECGCCTGCRQRCAHYPPQVALTTAWLRRSTRAS